MRSSHPKGFFKSQAPSPLSGWVLAALLTLGLPWGAKAANVTGQVTILTEDQKELSDRSGVVLFIDEVKGGGTFTPPATMPTLASQDMQFIPRVLPVLAGTTVQFPNYDDMFHNIFSLSKTKTFDLGMYKSGGKKTLLFDKPGLVKVYCNLHPHMSAYILVLGNPYFTKTDKDGNFAIPNLPLGNYKLVSWYRYGEGRREIVATKSQALEVTSDKVTGVEVKVELTKAKGGPQHKNKWGKDYQEKY